MKAYLLLSFCLILAKINLTVEADVSTLNGHHIVFGTLTPVDYTILSMCSLLITLKFNFALQFSVIMCSTRNATGHIIKAEGVGPEVLKVLSHRFNFTQVTR